MLKIRCHAEFCVKGGLDRPGSVQLHRTRPGTKAFSRKKVRTRDRSPREEELACFVEFQIKKVVVDPKSWTHRKPTGERILCSRGGNTNTTIHRSFPPEFKAQVVSEVLTGARSASLACHHYQLKPDLVSSRLREEFVYLAVLMDVFTRGSRWSWR